MTKITINLFLTFHQSLHSFEWSCYVHVDTFCILFYDGSAGLSFIIF